MYPLHNPETGLLEKPLIPERKSYYKDIAMLAAPANGVISKVSVIDLTNKMQPNGELE
jgi:hypothetical protein